MMRLTVLLFVTVMGASGGSLAVAQVSAKKHKLWTPDQKKAQDRYASYQADRTALRIKAQMALNSEVAREKAGDCPNAKSTLDAEVCLNTEIAKTQENYEAFAGALRAMLQLHAPSGPEEVIVSVSGPQGTPPTPEEEVASFDRIEQESKAYQEHAVKIAFQQFQGGTEAPVFEAESQQKLLRLHMKELEFVYGELLSNH